MVLGDVSAVPLDAARRAARQQAAKVSQGGDPSAERKEKQAAASMLSLVEAYLRHARARQRQRSFVETERHLRKHAAPLHHERAEALRRGDIAALASSGRFGRCVTCVLQPLPPVVAMVVQLNCEGAGGTGGERREAVLAQTFRMVYADRQRRGLSIPNAAFLISIHLESRNMPRRKAALEHAP